MPDVIIDGRESGNEIIKEDLNSLNSLNKCEVEKDV